MKKLLLIILVLCLMATSLLTGCGSKPKTPMEYYAKMIETNKDVTSMEAKMDYMIKAKFDGEEAEIGTKMDIKQVIRSATDIDMEMKTSMTTMGQTMDFDAYYKDGFVYQNLMGMKVKTATPVEKAAAQLEAANLQFGEDAILNASLEKVSDGTKLMFELSSDTLNDAVDQMAAGMLQGMGLTQEELDQVSYSFGDIKYELVLDDTYAMKSCVMDFSMDMTMDGDTVSMDCHMVMTDIAYNTVTEIAFPDDLDTYEDMAELTAGSDSELSQLEDSLAGLDSSMSDLENRYTPNPSVYTTVNSIGDNCFAALFLEDQGEYLDYYFWMIYQTQAGISAPQNPTGFQNASEISAEGLIRFFIYANEYQINSFAMVDEEMYYLPDEILSTSLEYFFQNYTYDPKTLPEEFGYESTMLKLPFALCKPAANACRIDKVEVLDASRVKITAMGLAADRTTPLSTQELVLNVQDGGGTIFESYSIKPL